MNKKSGAQLYLERVEMIDSIVKNSLIEQRQWHELALSITANMGVDRVQSSGSKSKMADALDKCIDMEGKIADKVDKLAAEKQEIVSTIEQVYSPIQYNLLHRRYIQYQSLQDIAEHYNKSYEWAKTTNSRAVSSVQNMDVSQILCKHRGAVKNRAKLFLGVAVYPPSLKFYIGKSFCACQGQRMENRCSFCP